jgi:hypothetical protein
MTSATAEWIMHVLATGEDINMLIMDTEMSVDAVLAGYRTSNESLDSVIDSERCLLEIHDRLMKAWQGVPVKARKRLLSVNRYDI